MQRTENKDGSIVCLLHKLSENSGGGGAASTRRHRMADWVMIQQIPETTKTAAT